MKRSKSSARPLAIFERRGGPVQPDDTLHYPPQDSTRGLTMLARDLCERAEVEGESLGVFHRGAAAGRAVDEVDAEQGNDLELRAEVSGSATEPRQNRASQ